MKIAFFEISEDEKKTIKKEIKNHTLFFYEKPIQDVDKKLLKNIDVISVFIYSKINKKTLEETDKLKLILTRSTGYNHIDLDYCSKNKIIVGNVPSYGENTVAEHTFALILNLARKVHLSYQRTTHDNFSIDGLRGFDLKNKTIGVLGVGHIGLNVIKISKGFGMRVKAFDIHENNILSEILNFEYATIDEILKTSDIISLHLPLNDKTKHIINSNSLKKIKKGAIIINTSRGELIDTPALYKALKNNEIEGAGLDVIEGEELISHEDELLNKKNYAKNAKQILLNKQLFSLNNVIFTPHNAFNSQEAVDRILSTTLKNLELYLKNKKIETQIN